MLLKGSITEQKLVQSLLMSTKLLQPPKKRHINILNVSEPYIKLP